MGGDEMVVHQNPVCQNNRTISVNCHVSWFQNVVNTKHIPWTQCERLHSWWSTPWVSGSAVSRDRPPWSCQRQRGWSRGRPWPDRWLQAVPILGPSFCKPNKNPVLGVSIGFTVSKTHIFFYLRWQENTNVATDTNNLLTRVLILQLAIQVLLEHL